MQLELEIEFVAPDGVVGQEWLLSCLQECAVEHAKRNGLGREEMIALYQCVWMVLRTAVSLEREILPEEKIRIRTWLRDDVRAASYREFRIHADTGEIGHALEAWVLVSGKTRQLFPLRKAEKLLQVPMVHAQDAKTLKKLFSGEAMHPLGTFCVQPEDLDGNGHMNNARYIWHMQTLLDKTQFAHLQINYLKECFLGDVITCSWCEVPDGMLLVGRKEEQICFEALWRAF